MRFKGLDLNLLQALDLLLEENHVSRAADRMHVTQPAMSGALTRLRQYFGDPLLLQHGKRMIPTPHALRLRPKLKQVLGEIDTLIAQLSQFDPSTADRRFLIGTSDYVITVIFAQLIPKLAKIAPHISFEFIQPSEAMTTQFENGELDVAIIPEYFASRSHPFERLYDENHVVVGWSENPVLSEGVISKEDFYSAGHVVVELGRVRPTSFSESHLQRDHEARRIEIRVHSFLAAPEMVVGTNRLTVMHERLARLFEKRIDIKSVPMPFELPPMTQLLMHHETRSEDPSIQWLCERIRQAVQPL